MFDTPFFYTASISVMHLFFANGKIEPALSRGAWKQDRYVNLFMNLTDK